MAKFTVARTDPSGANHTRRTGWIIRENGNVIRGPIFPSKKQALEWIARVVDPASVADSSV